MTFQRIYQALIVTAALTLAAGCDKIEPSDDGTYTVYAGAVGESEEGAALADHTHRVWIEKYTGPRCNNCPTADDVIHDILEQESYRDNVVATAIHATNVFGYPLDNSPDLRIEAGEDWCQFFFGGNAEFPQVLLNRQREGNGFNVISPISPFTSAIDEIVQSPSDVAIEVKAHFDSQSGSLTITPAIELLSDLPGAITLTVLFVEDSLVAGQRMPDGTTNPAYVHNHVLRGLVTDKWGADIDCGLTSGTTRKVTFKATLPQGCVMANCQVVAFVSDKSSRSIYNVASCPIN